MRIITRYLLLCVSALVALASCQKHDADIEALQRQLDELVTAQSHVNENVKSLAAIVEALQKGYEATEITTVTEWGNVVGYKVTFKESGSVTVYNSNANVTVCEDGGKYYWKVNGSWLLDGSGNKVEACAGAVIPKFRISSGKIEASLDGGINWTEVGKVGTPLIDEVVDSEDSLTLVLSGGQRISIPKQRPLTISLSTTSLTMEAGGGRTVGYTVSGGTSDTEVIVYAKDGWKAAVRATSSAAGMIDITSPDAASVSEVLVFVSDKEGRSVVTSIEVISTK